MTDNKVELTKVMYQGYNAAIGKGNIGASLYARGFLDGMNYQKDGTIPEDEIAKALRELKEKKRTDDRER